MRNNWTISDIDNLKQKGKINDYQVMSKPATTEKSKKPSKYRNKKIVHDGMNFDSIKERDEWVNLYLLYRQGFITGLERQVNYDIVINGMKICSYIADMRYYKNGILYVCDVKSSMTRKLPVYRLKKKLMKAIYNIEIQEV